MVMHAQLEQWSVFFLEDFKTNYGKLANFLRDPEAKILRPKIILTFEGKVRNREKIDDGTMIITSRITLIEKLSFPAPSLRIVTKSGSEYCMLIEDLSKEMKAALKEEP